MGRGALWRDNQQSTFAHIHTSSSHSTTSPWSRIPYSHCVSTLLPHATLVGPPPLAVTAGRGPTARSRRGGPMAGAVPATARGSATVATATATAALSGSGATTRHAVPGVAAVTPPVAANAAAAVAAAAVVDGAADAVAAAGATPKTLLSRRSPSGGWPTWPAGVSRTGAAVGPLRVRPPLLRGTAVCDPCLEPSAALPASRFAFSVAPSCSCPSVVPSPVRRRGSSPQSQAASAGAAAQTPAGRPSSARDGTSGVAGVAGPGGQSLGAPRSDRGAPAHLAPPPAAFFAPRRSLSLPSWRPGPPPRSGAGWPTASVGGRLPPRPRRRSGPVRPSSRMSRAGRGSSSTCRPKTRGCTTCASATRHSRRLRRL